MSWGTRRRNFFIGIFFIILIAVVGSLAFLLIYEEPNCFDGKFNQDEQGIDCGGVCELSCKDRVIEPLVHWVRYFQVSPGVYNAIAYVENVNLDAGAEDVPFVFKLYDKNDVNASEKTGYIDLKPGQIIPITISGMNIGSLEARRITFDFTEEIVWKKQSKPEAMIIIKDEKIDFDGQVLKITAEAFNSGLENIRNVTFVAIAYDENNNAIAGSSTFIQEVRPDASINLLFTWPEDFSDKIYRFEINPIYD